MPSGIAYVRIIRDYGHASECWDGGIVWRHGCHLWADDELEAKLRRKLWTNIERMGQRCSSKMNKLR
jgi:hypothetical protein